MGSCAECEESPQQKKKQEEYHRHYHHYHHWHYQKEQEQDQQDYQVRFSVRYLGGNETTYKCASFKELRVRLAIQAGVLAPCILLFKRSDDTAVHDFHRLYLTLPFEKPFELYVINNEEGLKKSFKGWSADKWINVARAHVRYGDEENLKHHAASLISEQHEEFGEKMSKWAVGMVKRTCNKFWEPFTPVMYSAVMAAIALGIDMWDYHGDDGYTFLHLAAYRGYTDLVRGLIDVCGANPNVEDQRGSSPLHEAAKNGKRDAAKLLIEAGADVNKIDHCGRTPLEVAWGEETWKALSQSRKIDSNTRPSSSG